MKRHILSTNAAPPMNYPVADSVYYGELIKYFCSRNRMQLLCFRTNATACDCTKRVNFKSFH